MPVRTVAWAPLPSIGGPSGSLRPSRMLPPPEACEVVGIDGVGFEHHLAVGVSHGSELKLGVQEPSATDRVEWDETRIQRRFATHGSESAGRSRSPKMSGTSSEPRRAIGFGCGSGSTMAGQKRASPGRPAKPARSTREHNATSSSSNNSRDSHSTRWSLDHPTTDNSPVTSQPSAHDVVGVVVVPSIFA